MNFLPIAILAYLLNGGSLVIDKILIKKSLPDPLIYTFFISVLQLLVLILIPFGFTLNWNLATLLSATSGVASVGALYYLYSSIKVAEASVAGPVVGMVNPVTALILGVIFLNQTLLPQQYLAFLVLLIGTTVLTANLWLGKVGFDQRLGLMIASGCLFGLSYILLRQAFLLDTFLNGLIISRATAALFVLPLLFLSKVRHEILDLRHRRAGVQPKTTIILLGSGQMMGAASGLMLTFAIFLASPALVHAVFGVQYLTILAAALILVKSHPQLLGETLTKPVIIQKIIGMIILSGGLYLLSQ